MYTGLQVLVPKFTTNNPSIDEHTTDLDEARALSFARDIIDIYSNGWGPSDSGSTVIGPRRVTKLVLLNGVKMVL